MKYPDFEYEKFLIDRGFINVVACDEAGRGTLISSVFAGAVIIPINMVPSFEGVLNDSKKLSEKKRKEYSDLIKASCTWAIGEATAQEIDDINILNATKLAMFRAISQIPCVDYALIDGSMDMSSVLNIPYESIIKGDSTHLSIAAASIIAKDAQCTRMYELDEQFPMYFLGSHKGYSTKLHCLAIKKYGPCLEHRKTFSKVREFING